jgi:hypothetical protein
MAAVMRSGWAGKREAKKEMQSTVRTLRHNSMTRCTAQSKVVSITKRFTDGYSRKVRGRGVGERALLAARLYSPFLRHYTLKGVPEALAAVFRPAAVGQIGPVFLVLSY